MAIERCVTCDRPLHTYPRHFNWGMARSLTRAYYYNRKIGWENFFYFKDAKLNTHEEYPKLAYWGLLEPHAPKQDGVTKGLWRITTRGRIFLREQCTIPAIAYIRLGAVVGFSEREITLREGIATRFDFNALVATLRATWPRDDGSDE